MHLLEDIITELWNQNFAALSNPKTIVIVYGVVFTMLFLENGFLPASFLPGDSLLVLSGAMVANGSISFFPTLILFSAAAGFGCWFSYLQGRWLGDTCIIRNWLLYLPIHYRLRAYAMFNRYGFTALLVGRFLAFIRTILPIIAGISGLGNARFQLFNWISALIWVTVLVSFGFAISHIPIVKHHENTVMATLIVLPLILLIIGLIGSGILFFRRKKTKKNME